MIVAFADIVNLKELCFECERYTIPSILISWASQGGLITVDNFQLN